MPRPTTCSMAFGIFLATREQLCTHLIDDCSESRLPLLVESGMSYIGWGAATVKYFIEHKGLFAAPLPRLSSAYA